MVGKTLELGLLVVFVGLLASTFYGGVLPEYRSTAAGAVADRTAAGLATDVEASVPATQDRGVAVDAGVSAVTVERVVDLPRIIRGDPYELRLEGGALVLDHPRDALDRRIPLALPETVDRVTGEARSGASVVIVVESTPGGLVVRLEGR